MSALGSDAMLPLLIDLLEDVRRLTRLLGLLLSSPLLLHKPDAPPPTGLLLLLLGLPLLLRQEPLLLLPLPELLLLPLLPPQLDLLRLLLRHKLGEVQVLVHRGVAGLLGDVAEVVVAEDAANSTALNILESVELKNKSNLELS